uniref:COE1_HLH domain-containing protein n=1 Tax=Globodera pallida TaxID=36090 RepID=A0A183C580_GLOPA
MGQQPQEAASQWINNERVVFRLFCRVQFAHKSLLDKEPQKLQGFALIREMFTSVAEFPHPVILSSAFILAEVLQFARLFNKQAMNLPMHSASVFCRRSKAKSLEGNGTNSYPTRICGSWMNARERH